MPLVTVKLIEGVFTPTQKQDMVRKLTDTMVAIEGENLRTGDVGCRRGSQGRGLGNWWRSTRRERCESAGNGQDKRLTPDDAFAEPGRRATNEVIYRACIGRTGSWFVRRNPPQARRTDSISLLHATRREPMAVARHGSRSR